MDPKLFMLLQKLKDEDLKEVKWYVDRRLAESAEPAQSTVEEYVPYRDGHLQLEHRTNPKTGTQRGPYWYFRFHADGKQRTLYIGNASIEEAKQRVDELRES